MLKVLTEEGKIFFFVKLFSVGNITGLLLRLLNTKSCTKLRASNTTLNSLLRKFTLNLLRIHLKEKQTISRYYFYLLLFLFIIKTMQIGQLNQCNLLLTPLCMSLKYNLFLTGCVLHEAHMASFANQFFTSRSEALMFLFNRHTRSFAEPAI